MMEITYEEAVPYNVFFPEGLGPEESAVRQLENVLDDDRAVAGALMADHHLGYSMPIGGVVAYEDAISPTGVGFDIACGNMAVQTNIRLRDLIDADPDCPDDKIPFLEPEEFNAKIKPIMRQIQKKVEFGIGGERSRSAGWVEDDLFDSDTWEEIGRAFGVDLKEKARKQLGTVGSGNHYVDLLVDGEGWVWVANHFGSRGLGHTIASGFMAAAQGVAFTERVPETEEAVVLSTLTDLGQFYVEAMTLAGEYAYSGRRFVMQQVLDILGAEAQFSVHNHHNFAWLENGLWIVRKGATPLFGDQPAFIGGSMGDISVIVEGVLPGDRSQREDWNGVIDIGALGSAPHGAGRVMSRTQAAGKMRKMWSCTNRDCDYMERAQPGSIPKDERPQHCDRPMKKIRARDTSTAKIDWASTRATLNARGITVLGAGADEAPGVYKPLTDVLLAHPNIDILYTLRPIGVVMAGPDTFDPYKD